MVEHLPELGREGRQVGIEPRVAPNRGHGPIQSPVGQGGDDECHLGPVGPETGGLGPDEILALLQETLTLVEVPRVMFGKRQVRFPLGVQGLPLWGHRCWGSRKISWEDRVGLRRPRLEIPRHHVIQRRHFAGEGG